MKRIIRHSMLIIQVATVKLSIVKLKLHLPSIGGFVPLITATATFSVLSPTTATPAPTFLVILVALRHAF